jgi:GNAT superfamily N-acetyltransferase
MTDIHYHSLTADQSNAVSQLIQSVIREFNAQDYTEDGIQTLMEFTGEASLADILSAEKTIGFAGSIARKMVGVCILREWSHLTLLFVDGAYHRRGIGRKLFELALAECLKKNPQLDVITVNSSLFAVDVYRKLGFVPTVDTPERRSGIIYVPMEKQLIP